jgi:hypothetical protein
MLKSIYKKLGIEVDIQSSKNIFINKSINKIVNLKVFHNNGENIFSRLTFMLCNECGVKYSPLIEYKGINSILNVNKFSDLLVRLQILINLSFSDKEINSGQSNSPYSILVSIIAVGFKESPVDLGYAVQDNKKQPATIYKKGVSFLDEKVVLEVLDWLENFPKAKNNYSDAIKFFLRKDYANSLTNSYSALESVAKQVLDSQASLDNDRTRNHLISKLNLDNEWEKVLLHLSRVSHEFSTRHGGNNSSNCTEAQAEFYLYQTGAYLRLISRTILN